MPPVRLVVLPFIRSLLAGYSPADDAGHEDSGGGVVAEASSVRGISSTGNVIDMATGSLG